MSHPSSNLKCYRWLICVRCEVWGVSTSEVWSLFVNNIFFMWVLYRYILKSHNLANPNPAGPSMKIRIKIQFIIKKPPKQSRRVLQVFPIYHVMNTCSIPVRTGARADWWWGPYMYFINSTYNVVTIIFVKYDWYRFLVGGVGWENK